MKYPFKVIRQYGEKKKLSPYYKFIEDNYLSNKINITTFNTIKYTTIALLTLVAVILKIKLIKRERIEINDFSGNYINSSKVLGR